MGRAGSRGFPKKNLYLINNKKLFEYPLISSLKSKKIHKSYVSTDCEIISKISKKYGVEIIQRPKNLCTSKALGEDVYKHAFENILKKNKKENIEYVVLLMANAPMVTYKMINKGVEILEKNKFFDSAVSVSKYNMWSPLRARKLSNKGNLIPFVPFTSFGNPKKLNCDRDSQGDVFFADMSVSVVRASCLINLDDGLLPQKWMGKKIAPIHAEGGCDVDYEWQIPSVKEWLHKNKKYFKI